MRSDAITSLILEKLTRDDVDDLLTASSSAFVPYRKCPLETPAGIFDRITLEAEVDSRKSAELLGFRYEGKVVAYLILSSNSYDGLIHFFYVDEEFRSYGVGEKLLKEAVKLAKKDSQVIYARTWSSNQICKNLYKKAGFHRERSTRTQNRVNNDRTIWYFI